MNEGSIVYQKSYAFALKFIKLYRYLSGERKEYVLSKQLLRAATSIGANVNEAVSAESKRDFVHKLGIALKEVRETLYWLNLLKDSKFINSEQFDPLFFSCNSLIRILTSIILTTKERYLKIPESNS